MKNNTQVFMYENFVFISHQYFHIINQQKNAFALKKKKVFLIISGKNWDFRKLFYIIYSKKKLHDFFRIISEFCVLVQRYYEIQLHVKSKLHSYSQTYPSTTTRISFELKMTLFLYKFMRRNFRTRKSNQDVLSKGALNQLNILHICQRDIGNQVNHLF